MNKLWYGIKTNVFILKFDHRGPLEHKLERKITIEEKERRNEKKITSILTKYLRAQFFYFSIVLVFFLFLDLCFLIDPPFFFLLEGGGRVAFPFSYINPEIND